MRKLHILGLTTILTGAVCAWVPPVAAEGWDRLGTVSFGDDLSSRSEWTRFGGPVDRLEFQANGALRCSSIGITDRDGRTLSVYSGTLLDGQRETVELNGGNRHIRSVNFACRSLDASNADIAIAADIDAYRDTWRESGLEPSGDRWVSLGREGFDRDGDREHHYTGMAARHIVSIGLEPVGADARCTRAIAHYDNGGSAELNVDGGGTLQEDRIYRLDLPGERNVREVELLCRAMHDDMVTINIYGSKEPDRS